MEFITNIDKLDQFLEAGGTVLWVILIVSILLWTLIIERYWYIKIIFPGALQLKTEEWKGREDKQSWYATNIRASILSEIEQDLFRSLATIHMLIVLCPLLGLVGTVTGMINVFDVVALEGSSNPKALADGVSLATIPTLAGLVTALSGYYFNIRLKQHSELAKQRASEIMVI